MMAGLSGFAQNASTEAPDTTSKAPKPAVLFGYLSYDSVIVAMPQYAIVQARLRELREAYDKEVSRVEEEFNQKYEAFLDGQRDFPRTILEFKQQGRRDLQQAEADAMAPLHEKLRQVIATVARNRGLALVVNTDSNACPFIEPSSSINIQEETIALLKE